MNKELQQRLNSRMNGVIEFLKREFASIRTGRASLALLDSITVDYHGSQMPINQIATLGLPDPQTITVHPWEHKIIPNIEKAILKSDLGLTPMNDGKMVRIPIPPLTGERRKQLVKVTKKKAEEAKIAIRGIRREINDELKKLEKDEHVSEDDTKKSQAEVQKIIDAFIKTVDEVLAHKDKEIMEV
ncbi:ribosome recycling factor [Candidatus Magnetobacterium bavaricum]|uniref:Ribosome-recycling factor n=1 Tax=Candidatus Magnetobacterium bavaricum TaxID=29290 RepID=A0A0F3GKH1_9BACT|nr:ribosome recycling factor [Candidatus Magnetobacterium bavaricum]